MHRKHTPVRRIVLFVALLILASQVAHMLPTPALAAHPAPLGNHDLTLELWNNFRNNLLKPLLLFFLVGLSIPLLKIQLEFPYAIYQGLTIYLLLSIGWHGGEELAILPASQLSQALAFMVVGFITNTAIAFIAYVLLRRALPSMRKVDAATVSAYYGSDSAGTFLACMGTLEAAKIAFAPYMPVMLAIMEIPGCLVGLYLVSRLRKDGLNKDGLMPNEMPPNPDITNISGFENNSDAVREEALMALENTAPAAPVVHSNASILREVFLNPGLFLLLSGIIVGYLSRLQGPATVQADDRLFVGMFQGMLCLFLLEMGITAAKRMKDLRQVSWRFAAFALLAPNVFACIGLATCKAFSMATQAPMALGTYVLFAVLCAASSYIAVPAVQRLAIPEASPTLPLAASLGVTFVYNVTLGIPLYMFMASHLI